MKPVTSENTANQRVHVRARVLAGGALCASILATADAVLWAGPLATSSNGLPYAVVFCLPAFIVAIPLFIRGRRPFLVSGLSSAAVVCALSVVGAYMGLFVHLPAALILVAAALTDPRWLPQLSRVAVATGTALSIITAVAWSGVLATSRIPQALSQPGMFIVQTSPRFKENEQPFRSLIEGDGSGIGFGTGSVSYGASHEAGLILYVSFREDLSTKERERLRQHLLELPEVTDVRLCSRLRGECRA